MDKSIYVDRSPRLQPSRPQQTIEIPSPPDSNQNASRPIWQRLVPLVTVGAYLAIGLTGMGRNPLYMIPMGLTAVISVVVGVIAERRAQDALLEAERAYAQRLVTMRKDMEAYHQEQREFFWYNHPPIEDVLLIDGTDSFSRSGTRLWERRRYDADFGQLRMGIGTMPADVVYMLKDAQDGTQLSRDAHKLAEDSLFVDDIPIPITLFSLLPDTEVLSPIDKPAHAMGICLGGKDTSSLREKLYALVQSMIFQYAAFHSPVDAQLCVVASEEGARHWAVNDENWLLDLPHCVAQKNVSKIIFPVCYEQSEVHADIIRRKEDRVSKFWRVIFDELERRKQRLNDESDKSEYDYRFPFLLVIVDLMTTLPSSSDSEWLDGSALQNIGSEPAVSMILSEGSQLGVSIVFLTPARHKIPDGCAVVVEVDDSREYANQAIFRMAETGVNTRRFVGIADQLTIHSQKQSRVGSFIEKISNWKIPQGQGGIPDSVTLMELEAEGDPAATRHIEDLRIAQRWETSLENAEADWLRANIGVMAGGETRQLHFFSDADGVHALVAGSTGSGKSELLLALVLSMAINYDPTIVNFVLVDFKGGAAFDPIKDLPHVVDVVTNLNESAVDRMFTAIDAELHRRESINTDFDVKHIVKYREKGFHQDPHNKPYPHLFIIIDEFAEMLTGDKKDEYRARLNSITRLGRALGVTLILAAQRPSGVSDQMRANIKCRICLRVEDKEGSNELLSRPDAAYLPSIPGRGYVQVGNTGTLQQVQMAFTGGNYEMALGDETRPIIWTKLEKDIPQFHTALTNSIKSLFNEVKGKEDRQLPEPRKPWPDPLPTKLALNIDMDCDPEDPDQHRDYLFYLKDDPGDGAIDLLQYYHDHRSEPDTPMTMNPPLSEWEAGKRSDWDKHDKKWWQNFAMKCVVGIIDDPVNIRVKPLFINLPKDRHVVLFGSSGWGKTTFLQSVLLSLAATHSPNDLHTYILDFGSQNLRHLEKLPHVGAYIKRDEGERIHRLFRILDQFVEERKQSGSGRGFYTEENYTQFPAVLVIIDNFAEFREYYWDELESTFTTLIGQCASVGIHFLITSDRSTSMTSKLLAQFGKRLALKLNDIEDYTNILNTRVRVVEDLPGRGFVQDQRYPVSFQVATLFKASRRDSTMPVDYVVETMNRAYRENSEYSALPDVKSLETHMTLSSLWKQAQSPIQSARQLEAFIGKSDYDLQYQRIDFGRRPHILISGETQTGKTTTLQTLILGLAYQHSPEVLKFVLVDTRQMLFDYGGRYDFKRLPHVLRAYSEPEDSKRFIQELETLCSAPPAYHLIIVIDNYGDFKDKGEFFENADAALKTLGKLARNHSKDGLHIILAGDSNDLRGDKLSKQVGNSRYGIGLSIPATESSPLNGKLSSTQRGLELPAGRGFLVSAGKSTMVQIAASYDSQEGVADSLDEMIKVICERYGTDPAQVVEPLPIIVDTPAGDLKSAAASQEDARWQQQYESICQLPDEVFAQLDQALRSKREILNNSLPEVMQSLDQDKAVSQNLSSGELKGLIETLQKTLKNKITAEMLGETLGRIIYAGEYDSLVVAREEQPVDVPLAELSADEQWERRYQDILKIANFALTFEPEYEARLKEAFPEDLFDLIQRGITIHELSPQQWRILADALRENFSPHEQYSILGIKLFRVLQHK